MIKKVEISIFRSDLAAHSDVLALVLAVRVAAVRLEEHLVLLTFSEEAERKLITEKETSFVTGGRTRTIINLEISFLLIIIFFNSYSTIFCKTQEISLFESPENSIQFILH